VGYSALFANTTGIENTAMGSFALSENTTGSYNNAVGGSALYNNTIGTNNSAQGVSALYANTTGVNNVAVGTFSLQNNTTGNFNLGIGLGAGANSTTGSRNIFLGYLAGATETGSDKLYIASNQITPLLYGEMSVTVADNKLGIGMDTVAAGSAVEVWNGAHLTKGGVWTNASSRELKDNIESLSTEDANAALEALSPVRYVYKNSHDEEYVGFIAEDVPELVATNDHKSLSPMDIVAVLTTVAKDQKSKMAEEMAQKDVEITELRDALAQQESTNQKQEERMLQMEMALAEVLRNQSSGVQVSSIN
jgi:hypothetical protein